MGKNRNQQQTTEQQTPESEVPQDETMQQETSEVTPEQNGETLDTTTTSTDGGNEPSDEDESTNVDSEEQKENGDAGDQPDVTEHKDPEQTTEGGTESTEQKAQEAVVQQTDTPLHPDNGVKEGDVVTPGAETQMVETTASAETIAYDEYAGFSKTARTFMDIIDKHIKVIDPKTTVNVTNITNSHRTFASALRNIFGIEDSKDFVAVMDTLVKKIKENADGAFSDKSAFRYWASIPMAPERLKQYEYALATLMMIAKSSDRKLTFRDIDFKMAFGALPETAVTRLNAYFKRLCGA